MPVFFSSFFFVRVVKISAFHICSLQGAQKCGLGHYFNGHDDLVKKRKTLEVARQLERIRKMLEVFAKSLHTKVRVSNYARQGRWQIVTTTMFAAFRRPRLAAATCSCQVRGNLHIFLFSLCERSSLFGTGTKAPVAGQHKRAARATHTAKCRQIQSPGSIHIAPAPSTNKLYTFRAFPPSPRSVRVLIGFFLPSSLHLYCARARRRRCENQFHSLSVFSLLSYFPARISLGGSRLFPYTLFQFRWGFHSLVMNLLLCVLFFSVCALRRRRPPVDSKKKERRKYKNSNTRSYERVRLFRVREGTTASRVTHRLPVNQTAL